MTKTNMDLSDQMAVGADNPSFGADYSFVRDGLRRYECVSHAIYYRTTASGIPPVTSRLPSSLTATAIITARLMIRPPSRTFT